MNFELLKNTILETHTSLQQNAVKAVNMHLTIRNWLIGFYIVEFEQKGEDRAKGCTKLCRNDLTPDPSPKERGELFKK